MMSGKQPPVLPQFLLDSEISRNPRMRVFEYFLIVVMDSAPSKTSRALKMLKINNCKQEFQKFLDFLHTKISIVSRAKIWPY